MYKFNSEYLKSIPKDEFIHWTGTHLVQASGDSIKAIFGIKNLKQF